MVSDYIPSEWEKTAYYHGVSVDPPELLYRSDFLNNPFPLPTGRFQRLPIKTAYGVFETSLNPVWHTVAPQIRDILKARKIRYSAIHAARFMTYGEDGKATLGPVVIWIATHPASPAHPTATSAEDAHFASPDILALLDANGVDGAVVEWFEGALERLSGPALLRATDVDHPTYYVRRFLTAMLGMPIATAEREDEDAQGSVAFFFHENKDKHGNPSARVFAVTNCHVLRKDTAVPYQFKGCGAPPQHVRLAGVRRFQRGLEEIEAAVTFHKEAADRQLEYIADWQVKLQSENVSEVEEAKVTIKGWERRSDHEKTVAAAFEDFRQEVSSQWGDIRRRDIGHVDWAPEVSVNVDDNTYTRDIGTFEVKADRFKAHFKGNVVNLLGTKFSEAQLIKMFYPNSKRGTVFKFPPQGQLRINGWVAREELANPSTCDNDGEPCTLVMKDGNSSDLTVGRHVGLEAYTCDELGVESTEVAIYNYNKQAGDFSEKGDSGSLIFDGRGRMVGILHSGLVKGGQKPVTYATPAWWVVKQLKTRYPHADFNRDHF